MSAFQIELVLPLLLVLSLLTRTVALPQRERGTIMRTRTVGLPFSTLRGLIQ